MNADSHEPAVEPSQSQSTPPAETPSGPPKVWVQILSDEEAERRMEEYGFAEEEKELYRDIRSRFQKSHFNPPVPVPPEGDLYYPEKPRQMSPLEAAIKEREEAAKRPPELVEDRIVLGQGDAKITRIHRRSLPAQPRRAVTNPTARKQPEADDAPGSGQPGPKPVLDATLQEQVCMYLQVGLSRSLAAMHLGFHKSTLSRTIQRDPEFKQRVLKAEAAYQKNRTLHLLKAANKSWRAGIWLFKHYHPHLSTRRLNRQAETKYAAEAVEQISQALQQPAVRKAG